VLRAANDGLVALRVFAELLAHRAFSRPGSARRRFALVLLEDCAVIMVAWLAPADRFGSRHPDHAGMSENKLATPEHKGPNIGGHSLGDQPPARGWCRWGVCGLLFFAATINYMDRQVIGVLKTTLRTELGWSESDFGNIVFAFSAAYAIGGMFIAKLAGYILDKTGDYLVLFSIAARSR
jgi:hypothetical protein